MHIVAAGWTWTTANPVFNKSQADTIPSEQNCPPYTSRIYRVHPKDVVPGQNTPSGVDLQEAATGALLGIYWSVVLMVFASTTPSGAL